MCCTTFKCIAGLRDCMRAWGPAVARFERSFTIRSLLKHAELVTVEETAGGAIASLSSAC